MSKHNEHLKVESIVWPQWLMLKQTLVHYKNFKKNNSDKQLTWRLMSWEWKWVETASVLLPVHIFFPSWSSVAHPLSPSQPLCNNRNLFPGSVRQPLWCEWPTSTKTKAPWLEKKRGGIWLPRLRWCHIAKIVLQAKRGKQNQFGQALQAQHSSTEFMRCCDTAPADLRLPPSLSGTETFRIYK